MKITAKTLNGKQLPLEIELSWTVRQVKEELEKYQEYLLGPDEHVTKKSSNSSVESDADLDWKSIVCNDEWNKYKITNSIMKAHLKSIGRDTKGNKTDLTDRLKEHYMPDDQPPQQSEEPLQSEQPNPAAAQASESNDVVDDDDVMSPSHQDGLAAIASAAEHQVLTSADASQVDSDDSDEDDSDDDDVEQEIDIEGVVYTATQTGIVFKTPGKKPVQMTDDPECRDPVKWSAKSQKKHAKYLENVQSTQ